MESENKFLEMKKINFQIDKTMQRINKKKLIFFFIFYPSSFSLARGKRGGLFLFSLFLEKKEIL
jgi:hypothetical protein